MFEEYDAVTRLYGYGETKEQALQELQFYILRDDITRDQEWVTRKEKLHSWCPTDNSLVFTGITAIVYENGMLTNTKTGISAPLRNEPLEHFITLYYLLNKEITYADFCITYSESINRFFSCISNNAGQVKDFPVCKPGILSRNCKAVHLISDRALVAELNNSSSVVVSDFNQILEIPVPIGVPVMNIVAYGFSKLGFLFNGVNLI